MTAKVITTTALLAALALGVVPAAASAQDYYGQGGYGYQGSDRAGYGGQYARQGYQSREGYVPQGYYNQGDRRDRDGQGDAKLATAERVRRHRLSEFVPIQRHQVTLADLALDDDKNARLNPRSATVSARARRPKLLRRAAR